MEYSRKAKNINPSITLAITAKAKALKAQGVDVVSFGAGEPDFNTPKNIIDAAKKAMDEGKTKYTAASGIIELKEALCKKFKEDNNLSYNTSNIIISTGGKQALANAMFAILNEGEEVLIPVPYWVSYPELVKLAGGNPVFVECKEENDYKFTIEALEKATTKKTKAVVINSPNNPTGSIYSENELREIAEFAKKHDLIIISDEMYEKLIYDGEKHISIASLSEDAYNRTIIVNGFSKAFAMTGWRLGYSAANEEITKLMSSIQSHMTSNANSITQYAAVEALNGPKDALNDMVKEFEERRNYMTNLIDNIEGLSYIRPSGAFYVMINIKNCINKSLNGETIKDSMDFSKMLLDEEKVAVIPGAAFGLENYIRLSYATSKDMIGEGLKRIECFTKKLK
ncbi:pyridoxal phosphate-dependent aminotransferase [Clostridium sp. HCP1S3_B4]|uniref:pyridoxal phosphate-dependent aminotransferase n=1 Tax=unclassified Clostridium TaxID=2614128 RepID=UPI002A7DA4E1|nr:pyridoxal phosphate-dependent aminotransferase [Clostridium sp.]